MHLSASAFFLARRRLLVTAIDRVSRWITSATPLGSDRPHHSGDIPAGKPWVCDQPSQIRTNPDPRDRVPWVHSQLHHNGAQTFRGKDQEDQNRGRKTPAVKLSLSPGTVPTNWENECSHSGYLHSPSVLQKPPILPPRGTPGDSGLLHTSGPDRGSQGRTGVVERPFLTMEWEAPDLSQLHPHHRDRCLGNRVGGSVQWGQDRRSLESPGIADAHQLPGAPGSSLGSEVLCQGQQQPHHLTEDGQHVSTNIHQQAGENDIPTTELPSQRAVAVMHGEEYPLESPTPTGCTQHHSGQRVQGHEGQVRLEAESNHLPTDQPEAGASGGGSVCQQADSSTAGLCQLETRSNGIDNRCLHNGLGSGEGLCQPSMEPHWEGTGTNTAAASRACAGSPSVESPGVVPSAPGDAGGDTTTDPPEGGSDPTHTPRDHAGGNPPTSRVGYLRQRYHDCQISEEATRLLLASWRQKSSKSYDSLFGKWVGWCSTRGTDPISCPIGEVVYFLAQLFEQGYQYRSLNAYHSAISSVHEKVDGYEVGQHPLESRLLKGVFHQRPPQPRYSETWDVNVVTTYLESLGKNETLPLPVLTHKTVMLLALTRPSRSADLSQLDLTGRRYIPEGVVFSPTKLAKQSRQSRPLTDFFFPTFPHNKRLCPVHTLKVYEERTASFREGQVSSVLFLTTIKPHSPAASSTIAPMT